MNNRRVYWKTPEVTGRGLKNFVCVILFLQSVGIIILEKGVIHPEKYTQEGLSIAMQESSSLMVLSGAASLLQLTAGLAIPIVAFLLVEGFMHTSDVRTYMLSVILFALISEFPYDFAMSRQLVDISQQNAMVGTAISLVMLYCLEFVKKRGIIGKILQVCIVLCGVLWAAIFRAEYGLCTVLLTAVFYLFYTKNVLKTFLGAAISLLYVTGPLAFYGIWCYNGERKTRCSKYYYYLFYPLHLLLLGSIRFFLS